MKICKYRKCKKPFIPKNNRQEYCDDQCRKNEYYHAEKDNRKSSIMLNKEAQKFASINCVIYRECLNSLRLTHRQSLPCHKCKKANFKDGAYLQELGDEIFNQDADCFPLILDRINY